MRGRIVQFREEVLMKVLLDLGMSNKFVSDTMMTVLKLKVLSDDVFYDLTLADETQLCKLLGASNP